MPATADPTRYGKTLQNLAWEVMDFWEWVRPEREERAAREMLLERVSAAAKSLWPQSKAFAPSRTSGWYDPSNVRWPTFAV
eukprot:7172868-Pyramimonas_sp.AAC.1